MNGFSVNPDSLRAYAQNQLKQNAEYLGKIGEYIYANGLKKDGIGGIFSPFLNPYEGFTHGWGGTPGDPGKGSILGDMKNSLSGSADHLVEVAAVYEGEDARHAAAIDATVKPGKYDPYKQEYKPGSPDRQLDTKPLGR